MFVRPVTAPRNRSAGSVTGKDLFRTCRLPIQSEDSVVGMDKGGLKMQYKVEFLPADLVVRRGSEGFQQAVGTIEGIINRYAAQGFQLEQVAQISVAEQPGCFASLFGAKTLSTTYNALIFRK